MKELKKVWIKEAIVEKDHRVTSGFGEVDKIMLKYRKRESYDLKETSGEKCRSNANIEGLLLHLIQHHLMLWNCLSVEAGEQINTLQTAVAYKIRKWECQKRHYILNKMLRWILQASVLASLNIR